MAFNFGNLFGGGTPDYASNFSGQNMNTGILSGLGDFISEKPEQFAIMADTMGKNADPNNIFANVGTMMGKSSLANKALEDEKTQQSNLVKAIMGITTKGTPGKNSVTIKGGQPGQPKIMTTTEEVEDSDLGGPITEAQPLTRSMGAPSQDSYASAKTTDLGGLISSPF